MADWFVGGSFDEQGKRVEPSVHIDADDLTTHGVIVGMTGSGKTGLGIIALEEALRAGTPVLVLDPKGDMGNLLLQFPQLQPSDFSPWVEDGDPEKVAQVWRNGLESWGLGTEQLSALKNGAEYTIYTPGSSAGVPMNVLGSLDAPANAGAAPEEVTAEIDGYVSGLLGLVDIESDPLASPEHILLANLVTHAWNQGSSLTLEKLIAQTVDPPMRKLGVFEVDTFFAKKERMALAMRLNGLVAKPGFEIWLTGASLDPQQLLWTSSGQPRAAVVALSHLSDAERQFVVTLILSKLVTWMRSQPGSSKLRALVYMDEVFGFVPPTKAPPSKQAILTILKQARAFGIGMILSTQNPVDLDYKAMSNAGTWMVGRLQTERDKARILEALASASGDVDTRQIDRELSGLQKRQFLLHAPKRKPQLFTTRWAMSYLRGPLTRAQIEKLMKGRDVPAPEPAPEPEAPAATTPPVTEPPPEVADGVPVYFADPASPWLRDLGVGEGPAYTAAVAARLQLLFDESKAGFEHREEWEAIVWPLSEPFDPAAARHVDYDSRDFRREPPEGAQLVAPKVDVSKKSYFNNVGSSLRNWLDDNKTVEILRNAELKLVSRVGEPREEFQGRCDRIAGLRADEEAAKLREKYEKKLASAQSKVESAERQVENAKSSASNQRTQEVVSGVQSVLGALLGGRGSANAITRRAAGGLSRAASRRSQSRRAKQRLSAAEEKLEDAHDDLEALEAEASQEIAAIDEKWKAIAKNLEPLTVGLEKDDIRVDEVALVWLPT